MVDDKSIPMNLISVCNGMSTGADIAFFRFIALSVVKRKRIMDIKDIEKYPAMTTYCIYRAWGEVYDFDFEMEHRSHKLLRTGFCYGGKHIPFRGVRITEECIACGECRERCSFKAIYQRDELFIIDPTKCDVCDDCYTICPSGAIEIVIDGP